MCGSILARQVLFGDGTAAETRGVVKKKRKAEPKEREP